MTRRYRNKKHNLDLSGYAAFSIYRADLDDVIKYPANWLRNATEQELADLGFEAYEAQRPASPELTVSDCPLTRRQLRLCLLDLSVSDNDVLTAIGSIQDDQARQEMVIEWEDGSSYEYNSALVALLILELGLDATQLQARWMQAKDK